MFFSFSLSTFFGFRIEVKMLPVGSAPQWECENALLLKQLPLPNTNEQNARQNENQKKKMRKVFTAETRVNDISQMAKRPACAQRTCLITNGWESATEEHETY